MRLKQPQFYRLTGVRVRSHLMRPRLIPLDKLILPLETVYQFWPEDAAVMGPTVQDPIVANINGRVFLEHVTELAGFEGNPRRTVLNASMLRNQYRRKNRGFRPLRKDEALTINSRNVLVNNYGLLPALYRYIPSYKIAYFRWRNMAETYWTGVVDSDKRFKWNQYLDLQLPDRIPTLEEFRRGERALNQKTLQIFNTNAQFNLLELWKWLGDDRDASIMSRLADDVLGRINYLVRLKGYFFVINLGVINEWRKDESDEDSKGMQASQLQRYFLRLLHGLRDFMGGVTAADSDEDPAPADVVGEASLDVMQQTSDPVDTADSQNTTEKPTDPTGDGMLLPEFEDTVSLPDPISSPEPPVITPIPEVVPKAVTAGWLANTEDTIIDESVELPDFKDTLSEGIVTRAQELHEAGLMSARVYERTLTEADTYKTLKDPFGSGRPLTDLLTVTQEDMALPEPTPIPDTDTIPDKSMLQSKLKGITKKYVKDVMPKDVVSSVMAVQKMGIAVKDYQVETVHDAMNHYEIHTVTLKPVRGRQSTVRFRLPVIDDDGRFISNGVSQRMRLQRSDVPIRKVNPTRVALTSYYNKTFVDRSERAVNNYERWLMKTIIDRGMDGEDERLTGLRLSSVFNKQLDLPRIYTLISKRAAAFNAGKYSLYFDHAGREERFGFINNKSVSEYETDQHVLVGLYDNRDPVLVDHNNTFYVYTDDGLEVIGTVHELLGIDPSKAPVEVAEMSVSNKSFPIGFVMAYRMGLSNLIESLNCEVNRLRRGERRNQQSDEYSLVFEDEVLVFSRMDPMATMILAGLNRYHQTLKQFSVWDFDRKDAYYRIVEDSGLGVRYLREIDALYSVWVDPITHGLLEDMGEPTDFHKLLLRSVELLQTDQSPEEVDGAFMRYRGYERLAGMVYGELMRSAKTFNARASVGENAVELNPHAVWQRIVQDPSVTLVEDANPIANLREQEAMTYRGDGGRGAKSMVERTRVYYESDVGVVSESTVDSGDVGVVAYLSPDANLTNLRGVTRRYNPETDGASKIFSSSALLAPAADREDPKRINFIAIQQQQGIGAEGYEATPLRTGYEQVVAHRTTDMFAATAEQDGKVVSLDRHALVVEYKDGTQLKVPMGKRHGAAGGVTYPHDMTTDFKSGDKVKAGAVVAYNRKFFTPDRLNPDQVVWKAGVLCNTALIDNIDTLEDGSTISERVSGLLTAQVSEVRTLEVRFDQLIHDLVKEGDRVDIDSILCTIVDPETADNPLFDEVAMDTLRRMSAMTPRAKVNGTVSRVEVYYHGELEDLSENLQAIAVKGDRQRRRTAKALGKPAFTGQVDTSFRVKGKALDPDTMAIRIYIDHDVTAGVGDKGVFANQMKTVFSRVMTGTNKTESGESVDAIFGNSSIEDRIVLSPKLMGTTNALLIKLSKHVASVYRGTTDVRRKEKS